MLQLEQHVWPWSSWQHMELQGLEEWNSSNVCASNWANTSLCFSSATNLQSYKAEKMLYEDKNFG